jgi:two-component system OmpR family response regulator
VLVVDDEAAITDLLGTALRYMGFDVRTVGSGMAALESARDNAPDLVVLDVQLPDMSGFDVASRLHETDPGLEIVLVSSRDRSAYGSMIGTSGARGFITKGDLSASALARLLA